MLSKFVIPKLMASFCSTPSSSRLISWSCGWPQKPVGQSEFFLHTFIGSYLGQFPELIGAEVVLQSE